MSWMLWLLIGLLILVIILLTATIIHFFKFAVVRSKFSFDISKPENVRGTQFEPFSELVSKSMEYMNLQSCEEVTIKSHDGLNLYGRIFNVENSKGTIILAHGYRSLGNNDFCSVIEFFSSCGFNLLVIDQRAHGKSEGRYIGFGVLERHDLKRWIEYVNQRFGEEKPIFLDGVSMGSTTVLMTSGFELPSNVKGIIADCGFTSPYEICKTVMVRDLKLPKNSPLLPLVSGFCKIVAGYSFKEYSTLDALKTNKIPVIFVHGDKDGFVPVEMTYQNYEACTAEKELFIAEGAAHGTSYLAYPEECQQRLINFFKKYS